MKRNDVQDRGNKARAAADAYRRQGDLHMLKLSLPVTEPVSRGKTSGETVDRTQPSYNKLPLGFAHPSVSDRTLTIVSRFACKSADTLAQENYSTKPKLSPKVSVIDLPPTHTHPKPRAPSPPSC